MPGWKSDKESWTVYGFDPASKEFPEATSMGVLTLEEHGYVLSKVMTLPERRFTEAELRAANVNILKRLREQEDERTRREMVKPDVWGIRQARRAGDTMKTQIEVLKAMTTSELAVLLLASQDHKEDQWFRDAIVDEIKTRKAEEPENRGERNDRSPKEV